MKCPFCAYEESKVIDSRPTDEGERIRRRRECLKCGKRFTTYEIIESLPIIVIKKDKSREVFDRQKLMTGMLRACEKRPVSIETLAGIKEIELTVKDGKVTEARVDMGKPETRPRMIPMITDHYIFVDQSLVLRETSIVGTDNKTYKEKFFFNGTAVSMGNPHFIVFVKDVDALDLEDLGPQFEHHKLFPEGVNTEFAQIIDENTVKFRVWERGSGETLACGTGACAVTYACMKLKKAGAMNKPLNVQARGGLLKVTYSSENDHIYLQGPAVEVFMGEIEIPDCEL